MTRKQILTEYLTFSRRDRIAILTLVVLIILVFFLPRILPRPGPMTFTIEDTVFTAAPPDAEPAMITGSASAGKPYAGRNKLQPFPFNPNEMDEAGWRRLGLREKTIATILRFRDKGGRFRQPGDLGKIYGLFPDEFERLAPYIRLGDEKPRSYENAGPTDRRRAFPEITRAPIDINTADTAAFIRLPGIGPTLARRIVLFREKLGGFIATTQVAETFGLTDSVFQRIRHLLTVNTTAIRQIDINTATPEELKAHPYFRQAAFAIVAWRQQHGGFKQKKDLQKIMQVSESLYLKMEPYVRE